jgi:hypothetical protein
VIVLGLVAAASAVASWLVMGWNLSEVDAQNRSVDRTIAAWRFGAAFALLFGVIIVMTWIRPRAWTWIAGTATVGVGFWFAWRGYVSMVHGVNMIAVGTAFLIAPVMVVTSVPAWTTSRVAQGFRKTPWSRLAA